MTPFSHFLSVFEQAFLICGVLPSPELSPMWLLWLSGIFGSRFCVFLLRVSNLYGLFLSTLCFQACKITSSLSDPRRTDLNSTMLLKFQQTLEGSINTQFTDPKLQRI